MCVSCSFVILLALLCLFQCDLTTSADIISHQPFCNLSKSFASTPEYECIDGLLTPFSHKMQPGGPPPPPPPPPLPPPPPPPPPPPGPGLPLSKGVLRGSRMRNFNWETLPKHSVLGKHNIWTADQTDGEYELDTDRMEELFSKKQDQQQVKALNRQSLRGLPTSGPGGDIVSSRMWHLC